MACLFTSSHFLFFFFFFFFTVTIQSNPELSSPFPFWLIMANYNVDALPPSLSKFVPASRGVDYRHTLPGRLKVGKLTKVLQKLDAYAASPERRFSPKDAAAAAKSIRRHVQDCSRKTKALQAQLEKSAEDNFLFRFHAVIGDYARVVCKALKESRPPRMLVGSWEDIVGALDKEEEKAARGIPSNKVHKQVEACVYALQKEHYPIDVDTALLAMRTYARRNYICHGEADQMIDKGDFKAAAKILLRDNGHLDELLPDDEKHLADKYRAILTFFLVLAHL